MFVNYWKGLEEVGPIFCGLENYGTLLADKNIYTYLSNTAIMWILGFAPQIALSIMLAAWFSNHRLGLKMWFGNTTLLLLAGMLGIDPSLREAAEVDGASSWQVFTRITLPLILHDDTNKTMPIVISLLRSANFTDYDNGLVYMVIAFSILPSVIIYLFLSRKIISGLTSGGIKG